MAEDRSSDRGRCFAAGLLAAAVVGCTGEVQVPEGSEVSLAPPSSPGAPSAPGDPPNAGTPGGPCTPVAGSVPVQRLTQRELDAAVHTVFGVTGSFGARLPSDNVATRYDNNAVAQQLSAAHVEGYLRASEAIVEAIQQDPAARQRWLTCEGGDEEGCARSILEGLLPLAFRREVDPAEVEALLAPFRAATALDLGFETAMATSLRAVVVSPDFLFRTAGAGAVGEGEGEVPLSGNELATRLAALVWGSVPDAELLEAARGFGDLASASAQEELRQTIRRMLQDPRSASLVDTFFATFLRLDMAVATYRQPDPSLFPEWDGLRDEVAAETRTFLEQMIARDESPLDLLTADYTYATRGVAEALYGLSAEGLSERPQRVSLPPNRRGILTQPTVLSMTSNPDGTSIVNRGLWIMDNLMCLPTPTDAPPGVPTETPDIEGASIRERVEAHRTDPTCAVCHATMDPLGFGLEGFDAIGRSRTRDDDGFPIDDTGVLPDGRTFAGAVELSRVIESSGEFERCLIRHMLEYGVGRRVDFANDGCAIDRIAGALDANSPLSEWMTQIALSAPFSRQEVSR